MLTSRAVVDHEHGGPEVLQFDDRVVDATGDGEVVVRGNARCHLARDLAHRGGASCRCIVTVTSAPSWASDDVALERAMFSCKQPAQAREISPDSSRARR